VNAWVSLVLSAIVGVMASWIANHIPLSDFVKENPIYIGSFVAFTLLTATNARRIQVYIRLYTIANIRGLWDGDILHKSLADDYAKSTCIDIKVTRGFGLFLKEDGVFKRLILEQKNQKARRIRILLHYPCLESDHLRHRATANHKSLDEYVDDLFKVLRTLFTHSADDNTGETISVRFYVTDKDSEWRFYVLEDNNGKKTLYFNHYDDAMSGAKSRMLKVVEGQHSLCDELKKTFDGIFHNASFEVVENHVSPRLLNSDRCGHPACEQKIRESFRKYFRYDQPN
jgi:hypothetical protein